MEAFKNPLTPEEEKKYIALCLSGDKAARSILIEYNLRLVVPLKGLIIAMILVFYM